MSFDWKEYVEVAEKLAKEENEGYLRSAISRAYYGVFCISRNKKNLKDYKEADVHWKVINIYKNSPKSRDKLVGKFLNDLRRCRNGADYDEDKEIDKGEAERAIHRAKEILKMLEEK